MDYTEYYNLAKPEVATDLADVEVLNSNMDTIDQALYDLAHPASGYFDNIHISQTGYLNEATFRGDVSFSSDVSFSGDVSFSENVVISGYINHDMVFRTGYYPTVNNMNVVGVEANPADSPTDTLTSVNIGGTVYDISGGSSVTPNPQGEPTDTLSTIEIDGTIYDIAGPGGGSFYKETTLWSGSDSATMTLSESFENYDAIMLVGKNTYNNVNYSISGIWLTSYLKAHINDGMRFGLANDSWYVYFSITNDTTFVRQDQYSVYISEIKGLKFGGGKAARIDLLWDYVNDNSGNIYWSGNALTLNGDIRNYDEVVVEIVSAQGDVSDQWKSSYQWRLLVDPLINSFEPGTFTMCSYDQRSAKFQFTNTTLQKLLGNGSENGVIRVYGVTYGGESKASEIIPISAGDDTLSRTFTFDKAPKFIKFHWEDTAFDSGWILDFDIVWGQTYCANVAHRRFVDVANIAGGSVVLSYSLDGKSVTITAANTFQACNTSNGTGSMFVDYGGVTRTGGENGGRTEDILFEKSYLTANPNTITLNHAFTDYDEIQFWTVKKDDSSYYDYLPINIVPVEYLTDAMAGTMSGRTNVINISGWQPVDQYLRLQVTSTSELAVIYNSSSLLIRKIVGIKY